MDINPTISAGASAFIDKLSKNDQESSATDKLKITHKEIKRHMPFVKRIAVITYEGGSDLLKTFIYSDDNEEKILQFYQSTLSGSESLSEIAHSRIPRIINDQGIFERPTKKHSRFIEKRNYGASYTTPFYSEGKFAGLIFINSRDKNVFNKITCHELSPFIQLISRLVCKEIEQLNILNASITTAFDLDYAP
jgi:transcriptional regulator with GAF, ATPase, and Fis domain